MFSSHFSVCPGFGYFTLNIAQFSAADFSRARNLTPASHPRRILVVSFLQPSPLCSRAPVRMFGHIYFYSRSQYFHIYFTVFDNLFLKIQYVVWMDILLPVEKSATIDH